MTIKCGKTDLDFENFQLTRPSSEGPWIQCGFTGSVRSVRQAIGYVGATIKEGKAIFAYLVKQGILYEEETPEIYR